MDARWFSQAVGGSTDNNSRFNCAGSTVDLSLKLGLTNKQEDENELQLGLFPKSVPASPKLANLTFNGSPITEETNQHEMGYGRGKVGVNSKGLVAGRGNSSINSHGLSNVGGGAAMHNHGTFPGWYQVTNNHGYNGGGGSSGVNSSPYNQQELNVNQELFATLGYNLSNYNHGGMPPLMPTTNNYTLLDHVPRSAGRETGNSSGSLKRSSRQQREKSYFDPNKRCTNYNCNTNNTPMWRKGPLGPKTLCNACGIKYRKEEERRRAGEANGPKV